MFYSGMTVAMEGKLEGLLILNSTKLYFAFSKYSGLYISRSSSSKFDTPLPTLLAPSGLSLLPGLPGMLAWNEEVLFMMPLFLGG
mmetsp:Transcript_23011/g.55448  ORF Transcript_23011/g.55448 Transcript_23011/m.55448 type:complete len:85 (-) Transcript_23011:2181-2435(-)